MPLPQKQNEKYSYADYLEFPDDFRCEIIERELYAKNGVKEYWILSQDGVLDINILNTNKNYILHKGQPIDAKGTMKLQTMKDIVIDFNAVFM